MTLLLGDPEFDPSGRDIPHPSEHIGERISSSISQHSSLTSLPVDAEATIVGLLVSEEFVRIFGERLAVGSTIKSLGSSKFEASGSIIELESSLSDSIVVRSL